MEDKYRKNSLESRKNMELKNTFHCCFGKKVSSKKYLYKIVNLPFLKFILNKLTSVFHKKIHLAYNYFYTKNIKVDSLKILHLSDLHFDNNSYDFDELLKLIKRTRFDLSIITGDFIDKDILDIQKLKILHQILNKNSSYKPLATLGNHDSISIIEQLESVGFKVLINESMIISDFNTLITGIDDTSHFYTKNALRCSIKDKNDLFKIVAAHTPELADYYSKCGYNLYISGHTHGGQINISKSTPLFRGLIRMKKLFLGKWMIGEMYGYTTTGVGCSLVPFRVKTRPEIALHTIIGTRS